MNSWLGSKLTAVVIRNYFFIKIKKCEQCIQWNCNLAFLIKVVRERCSLSSLNKNGADVRTNKARK